MVLNNDFVLIEVSGKKYNIKNLKGVEFYWRKKFDVVLWKNISNIWKKELVLNGLVEVIGYKK